MPHPSNSDRPSARRSRGRSAAVLVTAALAGSAVAAAAGLASAKPKPTHPNVTTAHNASLNETILVDSRGSTLYELSPESAHHLLCTTSTCLHFWPALKASSAKAKLTKGPGVKGKLGTLRRSALVQITLDGRPLYRFSIDMAKGQAHGNGIHSFGGVWHVVRASGAGGTTPHGATTGSTTTSTPSTYSYPAY